MPNGTEADIREIRVRVDKIAQDGCAYKSIHEKGISDLWSAVDNEREKREGLVRQIVVGVLIVVVAGVMVNLWATWQIMDRCLVKAHVKSPAVSEFSEMR